MNLQSKTSASGSLRSKSSGSIKYRIRAGKNQHLDGPLEDLTFEDRAFMDGTDVEDATISQMSNGSMTLRTKN
jgi:hypothetical protein